MRTFPFLHVAAAVLLTNVALFAGCGQEGETTSTSHPGTGGTSSSTGGSGGGGSSAGGGGGEQGLPTSGIKVIIEPDGQNAQQLIDAITGAETSVHMTMYILSDTKTIQALITAKQNGREVKVVLDQAMPSGGGSNTDVYNELKGAGVDVVWAPPQFSYTHEKTVIIDGKQAWIMTMNSAFTSPHSNREYLAIDEIPSHVAEAEAVFEGDFAGAPLKSVSGPLIVAPLNARDALQAFIGTAKSSLDIEAEEFSDDELVDNIIAAKQAGAEVRIVLSDESPTDAGNAAINRVEAAGCQVKKLGNPYVHAKLIVVDKAAAYVGSANFTFYSLTANRELGVLFAVKTEIDKIEATFDQDFADATPF